MSCAFEVIQTMTLINELRALVEKYERSKRPAEWANYPENEEEGKQRILRAIIAREPLPDFVEQAWGFPIYFYAGPFKPSPMNKNGWCCTSYTLGWRLVLEAVIEARIKEALGK